MFDRVSEAAGRAVGQAQVLADRVVPEEERGLIRRVLDLPWSKKLRLARRLWTDPRMGAAARAPLIAGLAYTVLPIKVTPPVLGPLRDYEKLVGLAVLLWALIRLAPREVVEEHVGAMERPGLWNRLTRKDGSGRGAEVSGE